MENLKSHQITEHIWDILLSMQDLPNEDLYINPKDYSNDESDLSYLDLSFIETPGWELITKNDAYTKIIEAVHKSLDKHQKVFLYYCPDNALISIEDSPDFDDDTLSLYDQISNNYYEGKD